MNPIRAEIGRKIKDARAGVGLTQQGLADELVRVGVVTAATETAALERVRKWENGRTALPIEVLADLAEVLGVNPADLLQYEKPDADAEVVAARRAVGELRGATRTLMAAVARWDAAEREAGAAITAARNMPGYNAIPDMLDAVVTERNSLIAQRRQLGPWDAQR